MARSSAKWMPSSTACFSSDMKNILLLFCLVAALPAAAQSYKDTTFSSGTFSCSCKYNLDEQDDAGIFDRQAIAATYPGGEEEWKKFVKKNIYKGFKGKHEVMVRFTVDKNGQLGDYTLVSSAPAQKYEEAVRILRLSGKWFPSVQKGFCVKTSTSLVFEL